MLSGGHCIYIMSENQTIHVRLPGYRSAVDILIPTSFTPKDALKLIGQDYNVKNTDDLHLGIEFKNKYIYIYLFSFNQFLILKIK